MKIRYYALAIVASVLVAACAAAGGTESSLGSLTLKAGSTGSRSITPASGFITSYSATGSGPGSVSSSSTTGTFSFTDLALGSWTFTVYGLDSSGAVVAKASTSVTISAGASTSASIALLPSGTATGTLSLTASWSSGEPVGSITGTLSQDDGASSTDLAFVVSGTSATYSNSALSPGSYLLALSAKDSSGTAVASATIESVLVYAGQTSSAALTISDAQFIVGGSGLSTAIPSEITVTLSGNSSSLSHGSTMTVTATPSASVDSYAWYLDGAVQSGASDSSDGSSSSLTVGSSLAVGSHTLMAVATKNAISFSTSCAFTVIPAVTVSTFAGAYKQRGTTDANGSSARFYDARGITTDGTNLYLVDYGNYNIRKIVVSSGEVTTLAGSGVSGSADGTGTSATFKGLGSIACDGANLYVSEYNDNVIRKIVIATGVVTTIAGTAGSSGSADGVGAAASFNWPAGLATDGSRLYVADRGNNTIRSIQLSSGAVTTLAGKAGTSGYADDVGTDALFSYPEKLATDGTYLYVGDLGNYRIRKIALATQEVTTLAGNGTGAWVDGTGTSAGICQADSLTIHGDYLYVGDYLILRKIKIATGELSTIAGSLSRSSSDSLTYKDGSGTEAVFSQMLGMAFVGETLYSTDKTMVRKITQE